MLVKRGIVNGAPGNGTKTAAPTHQPVAGEELVPMRGPALRLAENMMASLSIPTATSQRNIPVKDAAILSNCPQREVRRVWIHRVIDHDGSLENEGGIEAWLRLGRATGSVQPVFISVKLSVLRYSPAVVSPQ